ncbi:MAG: 5-formyltetrahydrofolate cyclo-ligase [Candidatus Aenigmatarchaeota archaeon]|nr:MAG: 5-formyltetrahydrofolate cyclo-ligase [Candidatus Aenigmarchaeota archaeon]
MGTNPKTKKEKLREKIWELMEDLGIARFPLPIKGRIPNFEGSEKAARLVRELEEWRRAKIVFTNPDSPQRKIREFALRDGKILVMASPKLKQGYLLIKPEKVKGREKFASTIKGAFKFGEKVKELPKPDLIVTGCVAVDKNTFYRLGKGGGYGDREIKTLKEKFGEIPVLTTIHEVQLVEKVPVEKHDTKVDIVVTPTKVIRRK